VQVLEWVLTVFVLAGAIPVVSGAYQSVLAGLHRFRRPDHELPETPPRVAVIVPAWNEAAVIGRTIDTLTALEYPPDRLRVYVVDDASTDGTADAVRAGEGRHPGRVTHIYRENGGQGKAHTLNHGLRVLAAEGGFDVVLIIDADVLFTGRSLIRMVRHLADPRVGAVTAYIKEGSRPANYMRRFVGYEYDNAQAAARRAQNVLGAQACLAGGAQLIRREALEAIGGQLDTSTLAEDTVTTLNIQLAGYRVVFEPHAIVWAEEPYDIRGLWKQRARWARGNWQVTIRFRHIWLRRDRAGSLGSVSFALIWFAVFLTPILMILSSGALLALYALGHHDARGVFKALSSANLIAYLLVTLSSWSIDPDVARRCWREAILFPGAIGLAVIVWGISGVGTHTSWQVVLLLCAYAWVSLSMVAAWLLKLLEGTRLRRVVPPLLYVVGYGPLLCAITAAAYTRELRRAEMVWEKTEKTGTIGDLA
jgi:cellulose synthase/poly-beta-1,6-N-acetylglucosamine synthase-like glycosyltransferase